MKRDLTLAFEEYRTIKMSEYYFKIRKYSNYGELIPAPKGFLSPRRPTDINKWQHHQVDNTLSMSIMKNATNSIRIRVFWGTDRVLEDTDTGLLKWTDGSSTSFCPIQFSAKSPSIMCKFLIIESGRLFIKRFQISFYTDNDYQRCNMVLNELGFVIRAANTTSTRVSDESSLNNSALLCSQFANNWPSGSIQASFSENAPNKLHPPLFNPAVPEANALSPSHFSLQNDTDISNMSRFSSDSMTVSKSHLEALNAAKVNCKPIQHLPVLLTEESRIDTQIINPLQNQSSNSNDSSSTLGQNNQQVLNNFKVSRHESEEGLRPGLLLQNSLPTTLTIDSSTTAPSPGQFKELTKAVTQFQPNDHQKIRHSIIDQSQAKLTAIGSELVANYSHHVVSPANFKDPDQRRHPQKTANSEVEVDTYREPERKAQEKAQEEAQETKIIDSTIPQITEELLKSKLNDPEFMKWVCNRPIKRLRIRF